MTANARALGDFGSARGCLPVSSSVRTTGEPDWPRRVPRDPSPLPPTDVRCPGRAGPALRALERPAVPQELLGNPGKVGRPDRRGYDGFVDSLFGTPRSTSSRPAAGTGIRNAHGHDCDLIAGSYRPGRPGRADLSPLLKASIQRSVRLCCGRHIYSAGLLQATPAATSSSPIVVAPMGELLRAPYLVEGDRRGRQPVRSLRWHGRRQTPRSRRAGR